MSDQISWTARTLGVIVGGLLLALCLQSPALASNTRTDINQFDIVKARSTYSHWTTQGCHDDDDIDDGCYVEVNADSKLEDYIAELYKTSTPPAGYKVTGSYSEVWRYLFEVQLCDNLNNRDSYAELNEDFNDCWERGNSKGSAEVEWPRIDTREYFEAPGFCKAGDTQCAISITICYNADECDGRSSNDDEFDLDDGYKADFFDDNESCLFDVSKSEFTNCVNRGLDRVYNHLESRGLFSYSALANALEDRGVEIDSYARSASQVRDPAFFDVYGRPVYPQTQTLPYVPPRAGYTQVPGPGGRYIVANFTQYLEAQPYAKVCGTAQGCVNVVGESRFFRSFVGNLFVRITNESVLRCMANRGYTAPGGYEVDFGNRDLAACDQRMARAHTVCPAPGTGAKAELLTMYNLGLVSHLVSPALAHGMQNDLNAAANTTPGCLCTAGFRNGDALTSTSTTANPWAAGAQVSSAAICPGTQARYVTVPVAAPGTAPVFRAQYRTCTSFRTRAEFYAFYGNNWWPEHDGNRDGIPCNNLR